MMGGGGGASSSDAGRAGWRGFSDAWPPSREQVTTPETTATAIKWGGRATASFLGIPKPCQFMGTPPFYGHAVAAPEEAV